MRNDEQRGEGVQDNNGEYELMPHEELEKLRQEVEAVKRNPLGNNYDSEDLIGSMNQLTEAINKLLKLFSSVNTSMIEDFSKHSLRDHFQELSSQNEKIAQGVVAVAKMVKNQQTGMQEPNPQTQNPDVDSQMQGMPGAQGQATQSSAPQGSTFQETASQQPGQQSGQRPYPQSMNPQGMPQPGMENGQAAASQDSAIQGAASQFSANKGFGQQNPAQQGMSQQRTVPQSSASQGAAQQYPGNQGITPQNANPQGMPPPPGMDQNQGQQEPAPQDSANHMDLPPPPPKRHKKKGGLFKK